MGGDGAVSARLQPIGAEDVSTERSTDVAESAGVSLRDLVAILADNKYFLGQRYAEWCTAAPTLESAVAAASMAQDEIGHARSFYPLLKDVASEEEVATELEAETRTQWVNAPYLDEAFQGWTDFVAANFLFDTALTVLLESACQSTFGPLGQRARRIMEEEPLHWLHAEGWTRKLAAQGGGVRDALAASLQRAAGPSFTLFDAATAPLVECGVLTQGARESREVLRVRVNTILGPAMLPQV